MVAINAGGSSVAISAAEDLPAKRHKAQPVVSKAAAQPGSSDSSESSSSSSDGDSSDNEGEEEAQVDSSDDSSDDDDSSDNDNSSDDDSSDDNDSCSSETDTVATAAAALAAKTAAGAARAAAALAAAPPPSRLASSFTDSYSNPSTTFRNPVGTDPSVHVEPVAIVHHRSEVEEVPKASTPWKPLVNSAFAQKQQQQQSSKSAAETVPEHQEESCRVYIGNLSWEVDEGAVHNVLASCGTLQVTLSLSHSSPI